MIIGFCLTQDRALKCIVLLINYDKNVWQIYFKEKWIQFLKLGAKTLLSHVFEYESKNDNAIYFYI